MGKTRSCLIPLRGNAQKRWIYRDRKQMVGCLGLGVRIDCKQAQGRLQRKGRHGNVKKLVCGDGYITVNVLKMY